MVGRTGFEPATPRIRTECAAIAPPPEKIMAEGGGIEPLGRSAHPGFQDRLPTIQRRPLCWRSAEDLHPIPMKELSV